MKIAALYDIHGNLPALDAVLQLTRQIGASDLDSADTRIRDARQMQRRAQFLTDFIEAENSMGFHAPQEAMRVLALSLDHTRKGEVALADALKSRP